MDIVLSLLMHAAMAFVKTLAKATANYLLKRVKDITALTANKDGSDDTA